MNFGAEALMAVSECTDAWLIYYIYDITVITASIFPVQDWLCKLSGVYKKMTYELTSGVCGSSMHLKKARLQNKLWLDASKLYGLNSKLVLCQKLILLIRLSYMMQMIASIDLLGHCKSLKLI